MMRAARGTGNASPPVFAYFNELSREHGSSNLGQGFPTFAPPEFVLDAGRRAVGAADGQQYALLRGHPALVKALSRHYTSQLKRESAVGVDEVLVANGGAQALYCAAMAFVGAGDEAIVFEPHFDLYAQDVSLAGGVVRPVPLVPRGEDSDEWVVDRGCLERVVGSGRVKAMFVNTPQNVPGKAWSVSELEMLAEVAKAHDVLVISDEVYDHLLFDGREHISMGSLPGMWERTITVSSISKTFGVTGWRIGWAVGPAHLIAPMSRVSASSVFSISAPMQVAAAECLEAAEGGTECGYYADMLASYAQKREVLMSGLREAGLTPVAPHGTFFALAKIPPSLREELYVPSGYRSESSGAGCGEAAGELDVGRDWHFCVWLTKTVGVTAIPVTAFCVREFRSLYDGYVRFTFCKSMEDIVESMRRLSALRSVIDGAPMVASTVQDRERESMEPERAAADLSKA